jgi:3-dehydroquinate synthase
MRKIFLYGPPGSGKSTIGRILSKSLNVGFVDIDSEIELDAGMPISQIMAERGEAVFREYETDVITRVCGTDESEAPYPGWGVVALGGGALLREENRSRCEAAGDIIFLETDIEILISRLSEDDIQRPLLAGDLEGRLTTLLERRKEHYDSFKLRVVNMVADLHTVGHPNQTLPKTSEQISWEIQKMLGRYHVLGMGAGYDVIVEPGGLRRVGTLLKERGLRGPIAIVCDEHVAQYYAQPVMASLAEAGLSGQLLVIKAGEEYKTLETVAGLWRGFLAAGLDRKSTVVALGGGVVGDLAGFAASSFMRGCSWMVVPTTLLSMVDASLGGKTGFDLPEGKNLVGAFYPPSLVLADPEVLDTLPDEELRSGLAEVVKHGVIADPELFGFCSSGFDAIKLDLTRVVRQAIGVKVQFIEQDPFEAGLRASLNLGHTVGHAVEVVSHYRLRHGEAVAIGMVVEARLAERLGLTRNGIGLADQIKAVLTEIGLPTEIPPDLDIASIIQAMKFDKKKERNVVNFALPVSIGSVRIGVAVSDLEAVL